MNEEDVLEKLRKKGFSLEIEVYEELEKQGWNVIAQDYYLDQDEGKARTVDLKATKRFDIKTSFGKNLLFDFFHLTLVVECKKSDNPLIFYMAKKGRLFEDFASVGIVKNEVHPKASLSMLDASTKFLSKSHYYTLSQPKVAVNWCVLEGQDYFFEAINQVLKALVFEREGTQRFMRKEPLYALMLYYPVIVFEGDMFGYESGEVSRTRYVQCECHGISRYEEFFIVDVIEKKFLPSYLDSLKAESDSICGCIRREEFDRLRQTES